MAEGNSLRVVAAFFFCTLLHDQSWLFFHFNFVKLRGGDGQANNWVERQDIAEVETGGNNRPSAGRPTGWRELESETVINLDGIVVARGYNTTRYTYLVEEFYVFISFLCGRTDDDYGGKLPTGDCAVNHTADRLESFLMTTLAALDLATNECRRHRMSYFGHLGPQWSPTSPI